MDFYGIEKNMEIDVFVVHQLLCISSTPVTLYPAMAGGLTVPKST
jgi:hypothetical protein